MVKKLILDTTLTYYCLNVSGQMYFSIIHEPHFECNKNLGRSHTCKVLGFLYQLVSKISIKSRKNSRKISKKAWVGKELAIRLKIWYSLSETGRQKNSTWANVDQGGSELSLCSFSFKLKFVFSTIVLDRNNQIKPTWCFLKKLIQ